MRIRIAPLILAFMLTVTAIIPAAPQEPSQPAPAKPAQGPRICQLVLFRLGPNWIKDKPIGMQPRIQEHAAYMMKLMKEGVLILGGPLLEDNKSITPNGAMMVLAVDSAERVREILDADPARSAGLLEISEIRPLLVTAFAMKPPPAQ
jgi:uncharacterized protein YciI